MLLHEVGHLLFYMVVGSNSCENIVPSKNHKDARFASMIASDRAIVYALKNNLIRITQVKLIRRDRKLWFFERTLDWIAWAKKYETFMPDFKGYMDGSAGY